MRRVIGAGLLAAIGLGLAGAALAQSAPDAAAVQRAGTYARKITQDALGAYATAPDAKSILDREPSRVLLSQGRLILVWPTGGFAFDPSGEKLQTVQFPVIRDASATAVDLPTARETALRWYASVSGIADRAVSREASAEEASRTGSYRFDVVQLVDGVECEGPYGGTIFVDRLTGLVRSASIGKQPNVRRSGKPVVSREKAVAAIYDALSRFGSPPRQKWGDIVLVWTVPDFTRGANQMEDEHRAAASAGQAMLMYRVRVEAGDEEPGVNGFYPWCMSVYVDATSGKAIAVGAVNQKERRADVFAGASAGFVLRRPPSWPSAKTELTIAGQAKPLAGAAIEACEIEKVPAGGVLATLVSGKDAWNVRFDRKSGLVWMEIGGKRVYGKPNAPLLKALRQVKPTKLTPFGKAKLAKAGPHDAVSVAK